MNPILVKRSPEKTFVTSIYRKKRFTGLYTKWDSFTPHKYKIQELQPSLIVNISSEKLLLF